MSGFVGMTAQADDPAPLSKEQVQQMYGDFLKTEGFVFEVDTDGDVVFKKEGKTYFLGVDADDPHFFRIVYPNFWEIENFEEHIRVLIAADFANNRSKVAKVYVVNQNTWASVELFVDKPEDFKPLFYRTIDAVDNGVKNFVAKMRGEAE
jgi:hypothetical protein